MFILSMYRTSKVLLLCVCLGMFINIIMAPLVTKIISLNIIFLNRGKVVT